MKVCQHCHRVNPDDTTRCINCGRSGFDKLWLEPPWLVDFVAEWQKREKALGRKRE